MKSDKVLWEKHVLPALNEMYAEAKNVFGVNHTFTFEEICQNAPIGCNGTKQLPYYAFLIAPERYEEIKKKYSSGFRHWWRWPYRSEMYAKGEELQAMKDKLAAMAGQEETDEYKNLATEIDLNIEFKRRDDLWHEYEGKRNELDGLKKSKEITTKEYNKRLKVLAQSYNCRWYSREEEKVIFNIDDFCPSATPDRFAAITGVYNFIQNGQQDSIPPEIYGSFNPYAIERINDDAKSCVEFYNNLKANKII